MYKKAFVALVLVTLAACGRSEPPQKATPPPLVTTTTTTAVTTPDLSDVDRALADVETDLRDVDRDVAAEGEPTE